MKKIIPVVLQELILLSAFGLIIYASQIIKYKNAAAPPNRPSFTPFAGKQKQKPRFY